MRFTTISKEMLCVKIFLDTEEEFSGDMLSNYEFPRYISEVNKMQNNFNY